MPERLVSVIIPTRDRSRLLGRAVASALGQTHRELEVIVVDDASTDDTAQVLARIRDPRLKLLRHDHQQGGSAARNTGLRAAQGELLTFLDSDDEWLPEKLARQVGALEATDLADVGAVLCGTTYVTAEGTFSGTPRTRGRVFSQLLRTPGGLDGSHSTSSLVRRLRDGSPPLWDETLRSCQDWDYLLSIARRREVEVAPDLLVIVHREHKGARIGTDLSASVAGFERMAEKYATELDQDRTASALLHYRIAVANARLGDRRSTRRSMVAAVRARPHPGLVALLGASLLGSRAFGLVRRVGQRLDGLW